MFPAEKNGDCYITDTKEETQIPSGLFDVVITHDNPVYSRSLHNAELIECASVDGRYWFAFRELSPEELYRKQLDEERDMMLDLITDQEYRFCLMELGLN